MTWNILHGGGARRMPEITLALLEHNADIIALTEYRTTIGGQIRGILDDHGWCHQVTTEPPAGTNGILLAAKSPLELVEGDRTADIEGRLLQAHWQQADTTIIVAHVPDKSSERARLICWRKLLELARTRRDANCIVLGDFNTGRHHLDEPGRSFTCTALLGELAAIGYADAWRALHPEAREFSWTSHSGNGFRIDSAFVSARLRPRVLGASYSHGERERRVSDHSALIVTLE